MGSRMFIPAGSRNRDLILDQYEPGVSARISSLLKPGMTFCDVGANLGIFTLLASRLVGPQGRVFAFEPIPENYTVLDRNIKLNDATNVSLICKAVSDKNGTTPIFLSIDSGSHSISSKPATSNGNQLDVEMVRLDSMSEIPRIDLLKIDVEGAELEVLAGLGELSVPNVILEYNAECIVARGMTGADFLSRLGALGFDHVTNIDDEPIGMKPLLEGWQTTVNLLVSSKAKKP